MEVYKLTILEPTAMEEIHRLEEKGSVRLQRIGRRKKKSEAERRAFYLSAPVMSDEDFQHYQESRRWMSEWRTK
jgi:hypothetical protein